MIDELLTDGEKKMHRAVDDLKHDLNTLRTGRASPSMLDNVMVDYYGAATALHSLAQISVPEARQLVIQPFDRSSLPAIEKAITKAELGITPNSDGQVIRLNVPPLTEERRRDLTKSVGKMVEEHKIAVRNGRRDVGDKLKVAEKDKSVAPDDVKRAQEKLQKITDRITTELDQVGKDKEADIMAV